MMKIYEVKEYHWGTNHVAYVSGLNKVVDYVISCCGGKIVSGEYKEDGKEKSVKKYKFEKNNKGVFEFIYTPLTKKQIREIIRNNKDCTFVGRYVGGYGFDVYGIEELTIE